MARFKTAVVAGASGSGKTLIAGMFQNAYVHSMDDYFRPPFPINEHGIPKWDEPEAIGFDEWITDYHRIKEAIDTKKKIKLRKYQFGTQDLIEKEFNGVDYQFVHWLILEGIFALDKRLHHLADIKVFVEAPFHVRVGRRLGRDTQERGNDLMFVLMHSYYTEESYRKYIKPQKEYADLVIPTYDVDSVDIEASELTI